MASERDCPTPAVLLPRERRSSLKLTFACCIFLTPLVAARPSVCQTAQTNLAPASPLVAGSPGGAGVQPTTTPPPARQSPESELTEAVMTSYGDHRVFGAAERCNIYTAGFEYDRHSWGYLFKARMDYVVEVLPVVILDQPAQADFWGNPQGPDQEIAEGFGFSPFGFRMLWRSNQKVKPYLTGKAGGIFFTKHAFSPASTNSNFNFQGEFGLEIRLNDRIELRLEPFQYFHVSNGYLAASNPGMDELSAKVGISYHLKRHQRAE